MAIAITNYVKNLPTLGKPQKITEDIFDSINSTGNGSTTENSLQEVIISCAHKRRRVCGLLNEGVKLSGTSEWQEIFGGGITSIGGSVISLVNNVVQYKNGTSFQQPWMNRKFWKSTKPFSFNFSFNFVSDNNNGYLDVWEPAKALLSFTFPRQLKTAQSIKSSLNQTKLIDMNQTNTTGGKGMLEAVVDTVANSYVIPGPAIGYGAEGTQDGNDGDPVTIVIGNLFAFGGVYLENVDVQFSPMMDSTGYPLWAKCDVKATAMDVNYCDEHGNFMLTQYGENQAALSDLVDSMQTFADDLVSGFSNIVESTKSALSAKL
ncbi:MAG: hypothetical protein IKS93_04200 [Methanobrevibacter sp.]|nr:hypothetical protein [Methanobrevibacter sp.]